MKQEVCHKIPYYASLCHDAAVNAGWWTDLKTGESLKGKKNIGEVLSLIHSELSEALEGYRKDLFDDHIPSRKMAEVELADTVIRIFDLAGGFDLELSSAIVVMNEMMEDDTSENFGEMISFAHVYVSSSFMNCADKDVFTTNIAQTIIIIDAIANKFGFDIWSALIEKVEYNKHRADHKIENRKKEGGKSF